MSSITMHVRGDASARRCFFMKMSRHENNMSLLEKSRDENESSANTMEQLFILFVFFEKFHHGEKRLFLTHSVDTSRID